jgi:hypothetical protein
VTLQVSPPAGRAEAPAPTPSGHAALERPRRRRLRALTAAFVLLLALDLARPAPAQLSARALLAAIHAYQATASPRLAALGVRCRFRPTCSHYAEGAIRRDGALVGSLRAAWRVLRCGPWTKAGTDDPP